MRVGYFGPPGTFTHEALVAAPPAADLDAIPFPTIHATVIAVGDGDVHRGLVPLENSLEGSVGATLDALALDAPGVQIVGETVLAIEHCLIARDDLAFEQIEEVVSHPQALAQCARFLRAELPEARPVAASSTAQAVRAVVDGDGSRPRAALGNRVCARLYRGRVLRAGVQDAPDNETRFALLAPARTPGDGGAGTADTAADTAGVARGGPELARGGPAVAGDGAWRTTIVFWGAGADAPGWLARCLSEFATRAINLTRIESRPRRQGLGHYMFFADLEGRADDEAVGAALRGLAAQTEHLRVMGSYPRR